MSRTRREPLKFDRERHSLNTKRKVGLYCAGKSQVMTWTNMLEVEKKPTVATCVSNSRGKQPNRTERGSRRREIHGGK